MKFSDNPLTSNQNENLITPQQQTNQQNVYVNQFFVENSNKPSNNKYIITFLYYGILVPSLVIILLLVSIIPVTVIESLDLVIKLISIIPGVIVSFLMLIFSYNKLEITKKNDKIIIKVINFLCFPIKIIKIYTENFNFNFNTITDFESYSQKTTFTIMNDYKNLVDIDLDTSNIKKKPAIFYYTFNNLRNIRDAQNRYTSDLFNLIGERKYTNNFSSKKYMKFSDHLFVYHFRKPAMFSKIDIIMLIICLISNCYIIIAVFNYLHEKSYLGVYIFVIFNIIIFIIYKCLKHCLEKIYRIDFIYSRDFDRIFIGIVKYNETSYINTFEFQMINIDKFILEKIDIDNYNLMAIFKDNGKQLICNIKKSKENLQDLAYFLNERLIKNKEMNVATTNEEI